MKKRVTGIIVLLAILVIMVFAFRERFFKTKSSPPQRELEQLLYEGDDFDELSAEDMIMDQIGADTIRESDAPVELE